MYTDWTKHLTDPKDVERFKKLILSAKPVLEHLTVLAKEKETALEQKELSEKEYDSPNWSHKQAYRNGYKACARDLIKLIDLDQQRTKKE